MSLDFVKKIGLYFLLLSLLTYILSIITFIMGGNLSMLQLLAGSILSLILINYKSDFKNYTLTSLFLICIEYLTILLAGSLYDPSFDGQVYHSAIIKLLSEGWNPFYHPILNDNDMPYLLDPDISIWTSYYAKGIEIVEAAIVAFTKNLETGKALNFWFYISLGCLSLLFFKRILKIKRKFLILLFTFVILANPVVINQLFTYYIDYTGFSLLCLGLFVYCLFLKEKLPIYRYTLLGLFFYIPSIKFNITFWIIVIFLLGAYLIYIITNRFNFNLFMQCTLLIIAGFLIGAYNPFVSNFIYKENILYPLIGKDKIDIITGNTPLSIVSENRFNQVNISLLSLPNNEFKEKSDTDRSIKELFIDSGGFDVRLGGFGILFPYAAITLFALFITLYSKKYWIYFFLILIFLYLSLFILPAGFWARYVNYFYLFPCICGIYIFITNKIMWKNILTYIAFFLLLIDGCISFAGSSYLTLSHTIKTDYLLTKLNNTKNDSIYLNSQSVILLNQVQQLNNRIHLNDTNYTGKQVKLTLHPTPEISIFPELYDFNDRNFVLKKLNYDNLIDTTQNK